MTSVTFEKARWQQDAEGCWLSVKVDKPKQAIEFCAQMLGTVHADKRKAGRKQDNAQ